MEVEITVPTGITTSKSVAWGGQAPELHQSSMEAIRHAVSHSTHCDQLRDWLEARTMLELSVDFHLRKGRIERIDIDSLLSDLMNPLVEGACGPREAGKPVPQTKDALFWRITATKIESTDEKVVLRIRAM